MPPMGSLSPETGVIDPHWPGKSEFMWHPWRGAHGGVHPGDGQNVISEKWCSGHGGPFICGSNTKIRGKNRQNWGLFAHNSSFSDFGAHFTFAGGVFRGSGEHWSEMEQKKSEHG